VGILQRKSCYTFIVNVGFVQVLPIDQPFVFLFSISFSIKSTIKLFFSSPNCLLWEWNKSLKLLQIRLRCNAWLIFLLSNSNCLHHVMWDWLPYARNKITIEIQFGTKLSFKGLMLVITSFFILVCSITKHRQGRLQGQGLRVLFLLE